MQGLENVDVPGLVILATGACMMGAMLISGIGSRRRDREAVERIHVERVESIATPVQLEIDVAVETDELSGMRELLEPDDDEITVPVLYTSADLEQCTTGLTVRPIRRRAAC